MSVVPYVFVFAAAALSGPVLALAGARPVGGDIALVVTAPWMDPVALVVASGGWPVGPGTAPFGVLARSDAADFVEALKSNGAWLVADGRSIARLCGVAS